MKHFFRTMAMAVCLGLLTACAGMGGSGMPVPDTPSKKLAAGYATVATVTQVANLLAGSGKMSKKDATNIVATAEASMSGLDAARDMIAAQDPAGADSKLVQVLSVLNSLNSYLQARAAKP